MVRCAQKKERWDWVNVFLSSRKSFLGRRDKPEKTGQEWKVGMGTGEGVARVEVDSSRDVCCDT